jgi:hypothetical protein
MATKNSLEYKILSEVEGIRNSINSLPFDLYQIIEDRVRVDTLFLQQVANITAQEVADAIVRMIISVLLVAFIPSSNPDKE